MHTHLSHEEPVFFPALRAHVTDEQWAAFSQRTVASTPEVGKHLLIGLFYDVGSADESTSCCVTSHPRRGRSCPTSGPAAATFAELERAIEQASH